MNRGLILPPNYTIRPARNRTDRWAVYRLLILERDEEPSRSKLVTVVMNPYTLTLFALLVIILSLIGFVFPLHDWFYILIISVLNVFGYVSFLQLAFLYNLFLENERRLVIALYREQIIGSALIAFRGNYSVLLGLYVAPSHRRRGVGNHLVQYILQRDTLPIYVNAPPDLRSFYARAGFVETNTQRGYNMVLRAFDFNND
ncbi:MULTISPECIES: GNAT family N-acetyltransferase [unclassified Nostoc]|uniref:GNAT family N-acetyltransferase n=1 Tax=unclassified Nostoc TaxID=2593658 RepID=UPI002AD3D874|nr:GNAT family N-acetyltransferase [Nostoc sp. DedQUE03]MDZ7974715.1 GNAT family N-acetyltransferase [Nostoc sp. DedQUE03]MDZ8048028.1 GNAT family N-acetyltransferase [Nostoc sp. DedQUE02]